MSYNNNTLRGSSRGSSSREPREREQGSDDNKWARAEEEIKGNGFNYGSNDYTSHTKQIQNDSLDASSRALGKLTIASEIATSNLSKLALQSEQLEKVDKRLDEADQHAKISETKTTRLKALNGWFFLPAIGSKSSKKKQEALEKKAAERESKTEKENRKRVDPRANNSSSAPAISSRGSSVGGRVGHIHSTPDGLERDSVEEGIDSNLNQI